MFISVCILSIILIPSIADAWGPLTHVYLGYQVLDIGAALIPAGVYSLLRKYRNDFLYGNLSADIILGRRFQGFEKNSHNWNIAWKLLKASKTDRQKAFAYGYLMHLCADTVVHNLERTTLPFSHSLLEIKSDSIIDKKYRRVLKRLDKTMQRKNDVFLEKKIESLIFSFKTNKRIFKGILVLSRLPNYSPVSNFIDNRFPYQISVGNIYNFQQESLSRMFELLNNGRDSEVLKKHPLGRYQRRAS
ncbi:MAG: zinc dependent phospholipase C family protein [Thermodesulfovibrionia bacterium]|nr:zinc dependent phospholipase C family protein [Thermodesulfovibrionia bacterium]